MANNNFGMPKGTSTDLEAIRERFIELTKRSLLLQGRIKDNAGCDPTLNKSSVDELSTKIGQTSLVSNKTETISTLPKERVRATKVPDTKSLENNPQDMRKMSKLDRKQRIMELREEVNRILERIRKLEAQNAEEEYLDDINASQDSFNTESAIEGSRDISILMPQSYTRHQNVVPPELFCWNIKELQSVSPSLRSKTMRGEFHVSITTDVWKLECAECGEKTSLLTDNIVLQPSEVKYDKYHNNYYDRDMSFGYHPKPFRYRCFTRKVIKPRLNKLTWLQDVPIQGKPPDKDLFSFMKRKGMLNACSLLRMR